MSYADEIYQSEIAQGTDPETARSNAYLLSQQPEVDAWSERYLRENPEFAQSLKPGWFSQAEWKSIDPEVLQGRFPHLSDLQFREGGGRTSRYDPDFVPGDDFKVGSVTNAAYKCGRWHALESIGMATKFRMKSKSLKPKKAPTKPKPKKRPDPPKSSGPP